MIELILSLYIPYDSADTSLKVCYLGYIPYDGDDSINGIPASLKEKYIPYEGDDSVSNGIRPLYDLYIPYEGDDSYLKYTKINDSLVYPL